MRPMLWLKPWQCSQLPLSRVVDGPPFESRSAHSGPLARTDPCLSFPAIVVLLSATGPWAYGGSFDEATGPGQTYRRCKKLTTARRKASAKPSGEGRLLPFPFSCHFFWVHLGCHPSCLRESVWKMMAVTTRRSSSLLLNLSKARPLLAWRASARAYASSSSSSGVSDHTPSPEAKNKKPWSFLKFGLWGSITASLALAGYATAAYSLEEIEEKTAALRGPVNYTTGDVASSLDKTQAVLSSAILTVPAKCVELYMDVRRSIEEHVKGFTDPSSEKLLPDLLPQEQHVFTLVLDLNETLVYSDWKRERGWRTFKRPGVDAFLEHLAQFYEIVVYSDQLSMYVDPIIERLDGKGCIRYRLSRAATRYVDGKHYRDLSKLNRDPSRVLYVSGHALESSLQPENSIQIKPWKLEAEDTSLLDLIPFLEYVARNGPADTRPVLASYQGRDIAKEFIERSKEHQRRMQEQRQQGRLWWR